MMRRETMTAGRWTTVAALAGCMATAGVGCGPKVVPLSHEQQLTVDQADPQMRTVLAQLHQDGAKPFWTLTVAQARGGANAGRAAAEVAKAKGLDVPEPVGGIFNTSCKGRDGNDVDLKVYTPKGDGPFPVLVYYHGGGWVVGKLSDDHPYDASCRTLCNMAHCVVVAVDYRLAPEHRYPAAVNDAYDAFQYVVGHQDKFKGDGRTAVLGESAGGNLAVATALMARDMRTPLPSCVVSVYPVGGDNVVTASAKEYEMAVPLDTPSLSWFYDKYLPSTEARTARYFDIDHADLHGLPPTTVITAQIDPLHDDGVMLAEGLRQAGVQTRYMNYDGVAHEFFGMGAVVDTAKRAETFAVDQLLQSWGVTHTTGGTGGS